MTPARSGCLSIALNGQGMIAAWSGDFDAAALAERRGRRGQAKRREPASRRTAPCCSPAYHGRDEEASGWPSATIEDAVARGEGLGVQLARWATAVV